MLRPLLASLESESGGMLHAHASLDLTDEQCEGLYLLAYRHYQSGNPAEARKLFALMATASPTDVRGHMGLAACLQLEQEHERALRHYFLASTLDLTDPVPAIHSAECFLALGRTDDATKALAFARTQAESHPEHQALLTRIDSLLALMAAPAVR